jgi:hypothetical protein
VFVDLRHYRDESRQGRKRVKKMSNILAVPVMLVVLLLGVFMPSLPDLDDGDDNVGCAAVMPLAPRQSITEAANDQRRLPKTERAVEASGTRTISQSTSSEARATGSLSLSQTSPPLRA